MKTIDKILEQRGKTYGSFARVSALSQKLKSDLKSHIEANIDFKDRFTPEMHEAFDMIINKMSRIANGDPTYKDSWYDIIGYVTLVTESLESTEGSIDDIIKSADEFVVTEGR